MRRYWCGIAPVVLTCLGTWGCATPSQRAEAPIQFRQWKPKPAPGAGAGAGAAAGISKSPADPATPPSPGQARAKSPAATAATTTPANSIWNYRPGSILFRRTKPAATPPAAASASPNGSLARFFPSLYGQEQGDPARLARARQPGAGDRPSMLGTVRVETTRNTLAADEPSAEERAPLLPIGLVVQAYPTPPAPPIVDEPGSSPLVALARSDSQPAAAEADAEARPAGAAEPIAADDPPARKPDLIDGLTARLEAEAKATPGTVATAEPAPDAASQARPGDLIPARDTLPLEAEADTNAEPASDAPAARAIAPAPPAALPVAPQRVLPSPSTTMQPPRSIGDPALAGRPRLGEVEPMDLPPPEFPPTYHTESLRKMARERELAPALADRSARPAATVTPEPHRPVFPRLAKLWQKTVGEEDKAVKPTSARRESAQSPGRD
jgi:hypothetical protein